VSAVQNAETVHAGLVAHGVQLAVVTHVLILTDAVVSGSGLLADDDAVFLLGGVAEFVVGHVEPLLLDDPGQRGVAVITGRDLRGRQRARREEKAKGLHCV